MHIIKYIELSLIDDSPYQGRLGLGNEQLREKIIKELKASIEQNGVLQPITVVQRDNRYVLIDGHRRVEACRALETGKILALIRDASPREEQIMSIVSNLQRSNLNTIEKALAFKKILDNGVFSNKRELSKAIAKDETYVGDTLNLLNMDKRIIDDLLNNNTTNDVRMLRMIRKVEPVDENGLSEKQYWLYRKVISEKLSRTQLQALIRSTDKPDKPRFEIGGSYRRRVIKINKVLTPQQQKQLDELLEGVLRQVLG